MTEWHGNGAGVVTTDRLILSCAFGRLRMPTAKSTDEVRTECRRSFNGRRLVAKGPRASLASRVSPLGPLSTSSRIASKLERAERIKRLTPSLREGGEAARNVKPIPNPPIKICVSSPRRMRRSLFSPPGICAVWSNVEGSAENPSIRQEASSAMTSSGWPSGFSRREEASARHG